MWLDAGAKVPLPALGDAEGARLPESLPPVVDAHVHVFPDTLFAAVWRWFEAYGWVFPGEEGAVEILRDAFALGLRGVKLHCHVQCVAPDAPEMHAIYETCAEAGKPIVMHAGREPASPHYKCDTYEICSPERVARVLSDHPRLSLVVPHLGADQFDSFERLLVAHDNLWLDTTMALAEYFPVPTPARLLWARPGRILYGTDFPNIPYAWDREIRKLLALKLPEEALAAILGGNALTLFGGD